MTNEKLTKYRHQDALEIARRLREQLRKEVVPLAWSRVYTDKRAGGVRSKLMLTHTSPNADRPMLDQMDRWLIDKWAECCNRRLSPAGWSVACTVVDRGFSYGSYRQEIRLTVKHA